ncbi:hypothetical protein PMAYCL1PPCAC_28318, partial [Pristionchus mayeri]
KFPTIVDLVEYYRVHKLSKSLNLKNVIARPNWMLKHENVVYEEKDKLGAGNFCSVYKGLLKKAGAEPQVVAIKISLVAAAATDAESEEAKEARKAMMQEAQIMSYYTHDNIIQFLGVACDHQPVLVLMEFCAGGDLLSHLLKFGKETEKREKLVYLYEAARGMFFLHDKKCVHRDLAARNCLISNKGKIKIADFGLSKVMDAGQAEEPEDAAKSSNAQVPVRWMAPETLKRPALFTNHSDVWAFGVMTFEVFSNGAKPWPDDPVKYVATQIRKGNMPSLPPGTPQKVINLVSSMWNLDASKRPNFRFIAREYNMMLKEPGNQITAEKMTINKINGVKRETFFEHEETSEFEDSSGGSTVEADGKLVDTDKVEKSADKRRSRNSKGATMRRTSSARDKKEASLDK